MVEPAGKPMGKKHDEYWKPSHDFESPDYKEHDDESYWGYASKHDYESPSDPNGIHKYDDESPAMYAKPTYIPYGVTKTVKKKKKMYDPGYYGHTHVSTHHYGKPQCGPIVCDPQYVVRDCYIPREVPVVHPVVTVNRHIIVNVPKHYYQPKTQNVTVDPGCPCPGPKPHGYTM